MAEILISIVSHRSFQKHVLRGIRPIFTWQHCWIPARTILLTPLVGKTGPDAMDGKRQDGMRSLGLQIYIYHRVGCVTGSFTYNFHRKGIILWA
jgi:hypothetical protein